MSTRNKASSPCVGTCGIDKKTKLCEGCKRSGREIQEWSRYTEENRKAIMERLGERTQGFTKSTQADINTGIETNTRIPRK